MADANRLTPRDGIWHFVRRVPREFAALDPRGIVKQSTKVRVTDDRNGLKAGRAADRINENLESYWRGLLDGKSAEAQRRYNEARKRARTLGFDYAAAAELAERPVVEILERLEKLVDRNLLESETDVSAVLGGEQPSQIKLSEMFGVFDALTKAEVRDLSEDQLRKRANPKKRAIANLIGVVGDKQIHQMTRSDALDFRAWWQGRILEDEYDIETANKDIGHINRMLRTIDRRHQLGLPPTFKDLRIEGGADKSRAAFRPEFVQNTILAAGALSGLNEEARRAVYLISETGLRLSEAANLNKQTINLDCDVPHVSALPDGRRMKTPQSKRDIPLVGVALQVMRLHPDGFPRYRDKADSLSALVNKYMLAHDMRPTIDHSLYSLRHTFEDRLTAVECHDKLIASMMGHKFYRPKYGEGPPLDQKLKWLQRIAFKPPSTV